VVDDACTADGGRAAAAKLTEAKVAFIIGFLCGESIEAALPVLRDAGIFVITPGVRLNSLTDSRAKTRFPVFRLGPRDDAETAAAGAIIPKLWTERLFAIVDDGTVYGRDLAESVRAAAEQAALKPIFIDTFRPQMDNQIGLIGRLRKAGATEVFVGGDRDDVAVMGRDAASLNASMTFAGGEALRAAPSDVPLASGTLMIGLPDWQATADPALIAAFAEKSVVPEGYVLPAYAAVQVGMAAMAREMPAETAPAERLSGDFQTAIGPIRFDDKGDLATSPYGLFSFDGQKFVPVQTQ
jgi:branched-chain amino acid transport system substrate-binding protein